MKILHVLDHSLPVHTGYTFRTRSILREQHALGWDTRQVTSAKQPVPGPDPETVDGLVFHRSHARPRALQQMPVLGQYAISLGLGDRLADLARDYRPDILHAHSPALTGLAALRVGKALGIPVVYECRAFWEDAAVDHGTTREGSLRYRLGRAMETHVFRKADAVTCICEGLRREIAQRGIPDDRVTVIPNAVDIQAFGASAPKDGQLAARLGLDDNPVIGFLGSFYAYEGLSLAIDALPRIRARVPGTKLLLVGGGPQEENLRSQTHAAGLADHVVFTGRVPHDDIQRYYDLVDILVYPRVSKRITELVTPLKPLEAMAQRRLVVASDVGGHRELIRDGETGRLFRAGDADALADAVGSLFEQRDRWPAYLDAGRAFVEQERSWARSVERYLGVYEGAIQRHRARR